MCQYIKDADKRFAMVDVPNDTNVAVVTALLRLAALIALFPLKCVADVREQGTEVTFCVGGTLG